MSTEWAVVLSALGGAIVGGAASTLGSIIVSRREVVRDAHRELLEDVPRFRRGGEWTAGSTIDASEALYDMHRHAVIAGRNDLGREERINALYHSYAWETVAVDMETPDEEAARWRRVADMKQGMLDEADGYRKALEKHLGRWLG